MANTNKLRRNGKLPFRLVVLIVSVGFAAAIAVLGIYALGVPNPFLWSVAAIALYAICVAALLFMRGEAKHNGSAGDVSDVILRESLQNAVYPILVYECSAEKLIWYNRSADDTLNRESLFGTSFESVFGFKMSEIDPEDEPVTVEYGDCYFRLHPKLAVSLGKNFLIITLENLTELYSAQVKLSSKETAVAYVIIDNLDEIGEYEKESYNGATEKISFVLREWADSYGAVLKEYNSGKYLLLIDAAGLDDNIEKKFDVLDRVRDVRLGTSAVPVTVSAGVSIFGATLGEREKNARAALEMALQRGGDQIVIKNDDSLEFFGGRTRTTQKRTSVRTRVFANELISKISNASTVLIMGHRFADLDCIGACIGLSRLVDFCGVPVHIISNPDDVEVEKCRSMISREDGCENLFVDTNRAFDKIDSDVLLIIADVNNLELVESPELMSRCANIVIIDHHRKVREFDSEPLLTYIDPSASATCEIVAEMLEQCLPSELLSVNQANALLAGIILDTKQFTRNTGTRTFSAALYLRDRGAEPTDVQELFSISLDDFTREARFRSNVVIYRNIFAVALADGEGEKEDRIIAAKTADKLLTVDGVKASFALVKIGSSVHISARSNGQINVQLILEELRGGGRFDAAGAQVESENISGALGLLRTAIDNYLDDNE